MNLKRPRPFALAISLAAAAAVFAADPAPKKKPAEKPAEAKPAAKPAAKPTTPKEAAPAAAEAPAPVAKPAPAPAANANEVVATVDGEEIKRGEVDETIRMVMAQRGMPADALPPAQRDSATRMMLDNLVTERIIKKASSTMTVSDAEVDAEIKKIRDQQKLTDEDIKKELAASGKTMDSLKKDIRDGMQQKKWFEDQIKDKVKTATEADAKDFYDKNPQHFEQPEMVRASHILFMLKPDATPEQVVAAKKKADAALARSKKEDFTALAKELSEEPGAKESGGDLDFFPREGAMVEEFSKAAYALKKGEISEPVRSQFGFHVIKVTDRKEASKQPFDASKEKITSFLNNQKKQAAAAELVKGLREKAKVEIKLPPPAPIEVPPPAEPTGTAVPPSEKKPVEAVTPPVSAPDAPKKP